MPIKNLRAEKIAIRWRTSLMQNNFIGGTHRAM
jgi:hypothetical protein